MSSTSSTALKSRLTCAQSSTLTLSSAVAAGPGPVDPDPQHHAGAFAPELHVEDLEPVAARDTPRARPFDDGFLHSSPGHSSASRSNARRDPLTTRWHGCWVLKQKKWAHAHFGPSPRLRTQNYSTAMPVPGLQPNSSSRAVDRRPRDQIVVPRADDLDLGKIAGAESRRVAFGQVDRGVDVGRLGRQPGLAAPARGRPTGRRPRSRDPLADPAALPPADQPLLQPHHAAAARRFDPRRHVVVERVGRRALLVRIGEDADMVEPRGRRRIAELVDVRVGLARETRR